MTRKHERVFGRRHATPDAGDERLIGYLDEISVPAGTTLVARMSSPASTVTADVVRLGNGDPRPPSKLLEKPVMPSCDPVSTQLQRTSPGSIAKAAVQLPSRSTLAFGAWAAPTRPSRGEQQGALALVFPNLALTVSLGVDADGRPVVMWSGPKSGTLHLPRAMGADTWHYLAASWSAEKGSVELIDLTNSSSSPARRAHSDGGPIVSMPDEASVLLGASSEDGERFDGRIEAPWVATRILNPDEATYGPRDDSALARWTFHPQWPASPTVRDVSRHRADANFLQLAELAVPGHLWQPGDPAPRIAPHLYCAAHFHADAVSDARWEPTIKAQLPADLPSGVYALRVRDSQDRVDRLPFTIRPSRGKSESRVVLVLPTMTYLAYANEQLPASDNYLAHLADRARPDPLDRWLKSHPEFMGSLYDSFADGCGITLSSWRRPITELRPDHLHWLTGEPRHLGADLFIVEWLERAGISYDVITDHDLDDDPTTIDAYDVVLTGSHPEYATRAMLDAFERHLVAGGGLFYLGGNGFYWVTSTSRELPGMVEVRRGPEGWPWSSLPGEDYHGFDGEEGGLWSRRGRPPHRLVGVTSLAMGTERPARGYRRTAVSYHPEWAWIFESVDGDTFGEDGALLDGAAGHEIDCAPEPLPEGATVLARSAGHGKGMRLCLEATRDGLANDPQTFHADLVHYARPHGGEVVSVSSICWVGSLRHNGFDNDVAHITTNILCGLLDRRSTS